MNPSDEWRGKLSRRKEELETVLAIDNQVWKYDRETQRNYVDTADRGRLSFEAGKTIVGDNPFQAEEEQLAYGITFQIIKKNGLTTRSLDTKTRTGVQNDLEGIKRRMNMPEKIPEWSDDHGAANLRNCGNGTAQKANNNNQGARNYEHTAGHESRLLDMINKCGSQTAGITRLLELQASRLCMGYVTKEMVSLMREQLTMATSKDAERCETVSIRPHNPTAFTDEDSGADGKTRVPYGSTTINFERGESETGTQNGNAVSMTTSTGTVETTKAADADVDDDDLLARRFVTLTLSDKIDFATHGEDTVMNPERQETRPNEMRVGIPSVSDDGFEIESLRTQLADMRRQNAADAERMTQQLTNAQEENRNQVELLNQQLASQSLTIIKNNSEAIQKDELLAQRAEELRQIYTQVETQMALVAQKDEEVAKKTRELREATLINEQQKTILEQRQTEIENYRTQANDTFEQAKAAMDACNRQRDVLQCEKEKLLNEVAAMKRQLRELPLEHQAVAGNRQHPESSTTTMDGQHARKPASNTMAGEAMQNDLNWFADAKCTNANRATRDTAGTSGISDGCGTSPRTTDDVNGQVTNDVVTRNPEKKACSSAEVVCERKKGVNRIKVDDSSGKHEETVTDKDGIMSRGGGFINSGHSPRGQNAKGSPKVTDGFAAVSREDGMRGAAIVQKGRQEKSMTTPTTYSKKTVATRERENRRNTKQVLEPHEREELPRVSATVNRKDTVGNGPTLASGRFDLATTPEEPRALPVPETKPSSIRRKRKQRRKCRLVFATPTPAKAAPQNGISPSCPNPMEEQGIRQRPQTPNQGVTSAIPSGVERSAADLEERSLPKKRTKTIPADTLAPGVRDNFSPMAPIIIPFAPEEANDQMATVGVSSSNDAIGIGMSTEKRTDTLGEPTTLECGSTTGLAEKITHDTAEKMDGHENSNAQSSCAPKSTPNLETNEIPKEAEVADNEMTRRICLETELVDLKELKITNPIQVVPLGTSGGKPADKVPKKVEKMGNRMPVEEGRETTRRNMKPKIDAAKVSKHFPEGFRVGGGSIYYVPGKRGEAEVRGGKRGFLTTLIQGGDDWQKAARNLIEAWGCPVCDWARDNWDRIQSAGSLGNGLKVNGGAMVSQGDTQNSSQSSDNGRKGDARPAGDPPDSKQSKRLPEGTAPAVPSGIRYQ